MCQIPGHSYVYVWFQRSYSFAISPGECYKTHTHTQSIALYGNATTHPQQSEGSKIQAWTWVSTSRAHKNSLMSRCSKHTLTILPGICISAYCIEQIQRVTSQASRPRIATLTGDTGIKKEVYQDWRGEESPKLFCVGGMAWKSCLENWAESSLYNAELFVSLGKQPCRKAVVWFQMSKEGKIPKSICFM